MAKKSPLVRGNTLTYQHDDREGVIPVETPAWYAWLETASSFAFTSQAGTFTARKERAGNQRGGWYWKAYHKQHGKLTSHYLGKTETLTLARLHAVAKALADTLVETSPERGAEAAVLSAHAAAPRTRSNALPSLLATKLHRPLPRAHLVRRPHLSTRLAQGAERPLTLVSAPAGFGKTTLLAQWLSECGTPAAWLSLDIGENDLTRFLTYVIAAVQTLAPHLGEDLLAVLQSPQPPSTEALLTALLNDLTTLPGHAILILDDYHVLDANPIGQATTFLLEHLPPQMHLVLATREDPQLPLARLRARGHLTELRAADLRFTASEAANFLNDMMGLHLSADDIATLEARTEGWITGLHLAAVSLQEHPYATGFIQSFAGSHQFVLDYLVEEVLHQQPERIQTFLMRTSILDRLCGPVCDAVVGDPSTPGQATLESLDHANLFLVPLDNERHWYRYHHLFAEVLRQRLRQGLASLTGDGESCVNTLHLRASQWYEDHGLELEAFHHAAAANDVEHAERLMEGGGIPLHVRGAVTTLLDWLASLPKTMLDARPSLWWRYAALLLVNGQTTGVAEKLQAAETALEGADTDNTTRNLLVGRIAAARATLALTRYQIDTMLAQSRRALEYLPPENRSLRANAHWTLGFAYWMLGERAAAHQTYADALALSEAAGDRFTIILATIGLGNVQEADNQLLLAAKTYRHILQLAGRMPLPIISEAHLGLARICYEWNDLEAAKQHGQESLDLARQFESGIDRFLVSEVFLARLKLAQGDPAGASARLFEASQSARRHNFVARLPEVAAAQVMTLLRQGQLAAAAQLAETHDLPLNQVRVYLEQGNPSAALAVLARLRAQAEAKGWADRRLQGLALEALALQAQGDQDQAVQRLVNALELAEPEGFIRLFVDEGAPMARLLLAAAAQGTAPSYIGKLLAVFEAEKQQSKAPLSPPPVQRLSPRELEVLRLIAQGLSNQEIGERLFLALDTVKGHNRSIFDKLQVQRRTEAIARAGELGLL